MAERSSIPEPGWSERINDPEILAGIERCRKSSLRWCIVGMIIALAAPPAVSALVQDSIGMGDAIKIGCAISGIMLICTIFSRLSHSIKNSYEGVVTDKREELHHHKGKDGTSYERMYVTYVKKADGSKTKIEERHNRASSAWEYLKVGDRFRYHPQLNFPYELYDKSKAPHLFCPICLMKNPVESDRCRKCNVPLLK